MMPAKKKPTKKAKPAPTAKPRDAHLPGYLMIAFGLMGLGINFDLLAGLEWMKAYPLLAVLFGFAALVKAMISKD